MELTKAPGVGISIARDLRGLGYDSVEDLREANPEQMYEQLCDRTGVRVDRCVLYVFRCATYFAGTKNPDPHWLKWWNWKDSRRPESGAREATG
ncbi:pathogenicity locus [bacterium]|nr:MAG: pathogenicity locus [bacterium]